jgi:RNA polymerase sigma-70 factor (ECF subfamily)
MEEDLALIDEFLQGNESSFNRLVVKYQTKVFNIIYGILGNYEETNEAAQDVFVNVYRALNKFRRESTFSTWLYRITVNTAKNRYVRMKRLSKNTLSMDAPLITEDGTIERSIADPKNTEDEILRKELQAKISESIDQIPLKYKEVLVMRDIENMDYKEIQGITGLNEGTIKSRLHRGRWCLKEILKGATL